MEGIRSPSEPAAAHEPLPAPSRSRAVLAVRAVESLLAATSSRMPSVDELALASGMPRRSLERAFRTVVGMSPAEYVRHRALAEARRLLLEPSSPGDKAVTRVAAACGFWHLGRFAAYYRRAFGETPSQTLKRASIAPPVRPTTS